MTDRQMILGRELTAPADRNSGPDDGAPRRRLDEAATRLAAVAGALLLVMFLVVSVSRAAFVDTTDNVGNSMATGTLSLTDDDLAVAMFANVTNLVPGNTVTNCINVDYAGSLDPTAVQLYTAGAPTGALGAYLDLVIEIGTGGGFGGCTGFTPSSSLYTGTLAGVAGFATLHSDYSTGLTTWDPAGAENRTFRFTLTVQDQPAAAGASSTFGFTWETRSA
jgi:hypothetical protein